VGRNGYDVEVNLVEMRPGWLIRTLAFAALLALDLGAIWLYGGLKSSPRGDNTHTMAVIGALLYGGLPAANILVIVPLISSRRPAIRSFVLGFEAFGCAALILYAAVALLFAEEVVLPYIRLIVGPLWDTVGPTLNTMKILVLSAMTLIILSAPQVVVALIGGSLTHWLWRRHGGASRPVPENSGTAESDASLPVKS
jgi:hypothetical protein